jgi:hypothetical protein
MNRLHIFIIVLTCPSHPQVATLMMELRNRKCAAHFGEDVWIHADKKTKACFNFLCGNHTRNLPVVRFNKVSTNYITFIPCITLIPYPIT